MKKHIKLEYFHLPRKPMSVTTKGDSQRIIQHVKQCVNICRGIRDRDHRYALILFTPPDTNIAVHPKHILKNGRVFGKHRFVASEQVDLVFGWAGGLEDDVSVG